MEDLDSIVARISHANITKLVDSNTPAKRKEIKISWLMRNVREGIFITSETWIDLPRFLRSRNKIKLFRLHQKSKNRREKSV